MSFCVGLKVPTLGVHTFRFQAKPALFGLCYEKVSVSMRPIRTLGGKANLSVKLGLDFNFYSGVDVKGIEGPP